LVYGGYILHPRGGHFPLSEKEGANKILQKAIYKTAQKAQIATDK
jgi:hypothetical protein